MGFLGGGSNQKSREGESFVCYFVVVSWVGLGSFVFGLSIEMMFILSEAKLDSQGSGRGIFRGVDFDDSY